MIEKNNNNPERPLECSECKKPIVVIYTEIVGKTMTRTAMCFDCPELRRKIFGEKAVRLSGLPSDTDLCCGNCGTTLESIKKGSPFGCTDCYEVFGDILIQEMIAANKISPRISSAKKSIPLHIGRSPGETKEINPTLRLLALNEALNETLKREDYEQAAWLRDQIKALTENQEKKVENEGNSNERKA